MSVKWRSTAKSPFDNPLVKYRVYVDSESEVPEGYDVQYGQRGGIFYEVESDGGDDDEPEFGEDDSYTVTGDYNVDTQFGARVAEAVNNDRVVEEVAANEWMSLAGEIKDTDLLVDALHQIIENDGTKTARERVRRRLRGLGLDDDEIDATLDQTREGGEEPSDDDMWDDDMARNMVESLPQYSNTVRYNEGHFETVRDIFEATPTHVFEEFVKEQLEESGELNAAGRTAATALYYRDDGQTWSPTKILGMESHPSNPDKDTMVDRELRSTLHKLDPVVGMWAMMQLNGIRWADLGKKLNGTHQSVGRIKLDSKSAGRTTVAHEFGHQVHESLGLKVQTGTYPDDWKDISRNDPVWGVSYPLGGAAGDLYDAAKEHWQRYQGGETAEIRPYQRRHGVEYLAVTFSRWATDSKKIETRDPYAKQFWDVTAGDSEYVESIDELQEGDEIVFLTSGHNPENYKIEQMPDDSDDEWTVSVPSTYGEVFYQLSDEQIAAGFEQGITHG